MSHLSQLRGLLRIQRLSMKIYEQVKAYAMSFIFEAVR